MLNFTYFAILLIIYLLLECPEPLLDLATAPVIVAGAGLAGLTATFELLRRGNSVILVEKTGRFGGSSAKASSGVSACETRQQQKLNIDDDAATFGADVLRSGGDSSFLSLVQIFAERSGSTVDDLAVQLNWTLSDVNALGGHSKPRTHRQPPRPDIVASFGFELIRDLEKVLEGREQAGKLKILKNTKLTDLQVVRRDGLLVVDSVTLRTGDEPPQIFDRVKALVIATGGYGGSTDPENSVLARHRPDLAGFPTTSAASSTGDVTQLLADRGFKLYEPQRVQLHPTAFVNATDPLAPRKFLCPEVMRSLGAILVDPAGRRFVDELQTRDVVSAAIQLHGGSPAQWGLRQLPRDDALQREQAIALLAFDENTARAFGPKNIEFYARLKLVYPAAKLHEVTPIVKLTDLEAAAGKSIDYVALVTPAVHYTIGGVLVDELTRPVSAAARLDTRALIVNQIELAAQNIFIAGEAAAGIHGANRLGGNGVAECMIFGRLAAEMADRIGGRSAPPPGGVLSKLSVLAHATSGHRQQVLLISDYWLDEIPNVARFNVVARQPGLVIVETPATLTIRSGDRFEQDR